MDLQSLSTDQLMALRSQAASGADVDGQPDEARLRITVRPGTARPLSEMSTQELTALRESLAPRGVIDTAKGLYKAADAGAVTGVAALAGALGDVTDLGANGIHAATNYVERKFGLPESAGPTPRSGSIMDRIIPNSAEVAKNIQQKMYGGEQPYQPKGIAEEYARSVGEFIPAALAGGGGVVARTAQAVVPGVVSETLGRLTKDTKWEHSARTAGALIGSAGASMASRPSTAARAIREQLPEGVTPQIVDDAAALVERSAHQGVLLSWPEALSQVAGRPILTNTLRHLEAAPQTEAQMAEFFSQRPQQVDRAARTAFDDIAPINPAPSTIGPAAGREAQGTIDAVRGAINQHTRPNYQAATAQRIDPATFAQVSQDPVFQEGLRRVRTDPFIGPTLRGQPDDSIAVIDAIKKQLDETGRNLRSSGAGTARNNFAASIVEQGNTRMVQAADAATGSAPGRMGTYERARTEQADLRQQYLQPLLDGPLGKIAGRDTTTQKAIAALFPTNPLPNSAQEISTAVTALARRNPRGASDLVRAHVEGVFNEAAQNLQTGANQAGGAKFAAVLVGNPQQRANLEAAVTALPQGAERWRGFNNLLETLEATGTRQGIGSRTAYNDEFLREAARGGVVGDAVKTVANPTRAGQKFVDRFERWKLGKDLGDLATILTDPRSVNLLRAISRMNPGSGQAQSVAARLVAVGASSRSSEPVQAPRQ